VQQATAENLHAEFRLRQDVENLHGFFHVGQDYADLKNEMFIQYKFKDLKGIFTLRQETAELKAEFEVSSLQLDTYTIVGTSGSQGLTGAQYVTIPEMTKDLVCETGDILMISLDCAFDYGGTYETRMRIEVDSVAVGEATIRDPASLGEEGSLSITRAYVVPADATYTIEGKVYSGGSGNQTEGNFRTLTIQHFHN
jgi:hypothetical protein